MPDIEIDPRTGLPRLEEGEHWLIKEACRPGGDPFGPDFERDMCDWVQIVKDGTPVLRWSYPVLDEYDNRLPLTKERILAVAVSIVKAREAERQSALLRGTYPPKVL